jgi:hypothetical protein
MGEFAGMTTVPGLVAARTVAPSGTAAWLPQAAISSRTPGAIKREERFIDHLAAMRHGARRACARSGERLDFVIRRKKRMTAFFNPM